MGFAMLGIVPTTSELTARLLNGLPSEQAKRFVAMIVQRNGQFSYR
jgi:hypothetical protein